MSRKYNHNHDPANGQFTTVDGGSAGGAGGAGDMVDGFRMTQADRREFERDHGVSASSSEAEKIAAIEKEAEGGDSSHALADWMARQYGFRGVYGGRVRKSARTPTPPGPHKVYG